MSKILLIDDTDSYPNLIRGMYETKYSFDQVKSLAAAEDVLKNTSYDLICLNWDYPDKASANDFLKRISSLIPSLKVIVITAYANQLPGGTIGSFLAEHKNVVVDIIAKGPNSLEKMQRLGVKFAEIIREKNMISWLHISDLHIGSERNQYDWPRISEALLQDIEYHRVELSSQSGHTANVQFQPDLIFVTGDIANKGKVEEFEKAKRFLEDLWKITGLGRETTLIVPGNHDVNREYLIDKQYHQLVYDRLKHVLSEANSLDAASKWDDEVCHISNDSMFNQIILGKFENYRNFIKECTTQPHDKLHYIHHVQIGESKVAVIGLCSALMSCTKFEDSEGGLWIGTPQIEAVRAELAKSDATRRIMLIHHPSESLHPFEKYLAWKFIEDRANIVLHGHLHRPDSYIKHLPQKRHLRIQAGAISTGNIWNTHNYSYGSFNLGLGQVDLYMRKTDGNIPPTYVSDNTTYPIDAPDGHAQFFL